MKPAALLCRPATLVVVLAVVGGLDRATAVEGA